MRAAAVSSGHRHIFSADHSRNPRQTCCHSSLCSSGHRTAFTAFNLPQNLCSKRVCSFLQRPSSRHKLAAFAEQATYQNVHEYIVLFKVFHVLRSLFQHVANVVQKVPQCSLANLLCCFTAVSCLPQVNDGIDPESAEAMLDNFWSLQYMIPAGVLNGFAGPVKSRGSHPDLSMSHALHLRFGSMEV